MRPLWNRNVLERFICKYAFVTRVLLLEFDRESTRQNIKHDLLVVKPVVLEINILSSVCNHCIPRQVCHARSQNGGFSFLKGLFRCMVLFRGVFLMARTVLC